MNYLAPLGRVFGNLKGFYSGINGATLTGAIDVVVVEQEDGSFKCSPFHVRFGKLGVLRSKEKVVDIEVNGVSAPIRMKLGDCGEAFFVQEIDSEDELDDENLATSPLPGSPRQLEFESQLPENVIEEIVDPTTLKGGPNEVVIAIEEDEKDGVPNENAIHGSASTPNLEAAAGDLKSRKRRKKRRRNQGSKSDIKIDMADTPPETSETIFRMDDEDLSGSVSSTLKSLENGTISHSRSFHRDFFSDTEIDPTNTPPNSRPNTPIQSDSEYEISKVHKDADDEEVSKWVWGELPSTGNTTPTTTPMGFPGVGPQTANGRKTPAATKRVDENALSSDDEGSKDRNENKSMLSGMFSMLQFKKTGAATSDEPTASSGIYLDDLNIENMDPEVAALYFPNFHQNRTSSNTDHEEDGESGKGSSLPQSPAPGSSPKITSQLLDDNMIMAERKRNESSSSDSQSKFEAVSFCGSSLNLFDQSQLSYDELIENPEVLLTTPPESIVVKIDGKLVPWNAALPQLLSTTFFKRPLPPHVYQKLIEHTVKKEEGAASLESSVNSSSSLDKDGASGSRKVYSSWFPWRRYTSDQSNMDPLNVSPEGGHSSMKGQESLKLKSSPSKNIISGNNNSNNQPIQSVTSSSDESEGTGGQGNNNKTPRPTRASGTMPIAIQDSCNIPDKFKKTLRLTSEQIKALGLNYGQNEAVFSVTTAYQGTTIARCHIYLWKYDDRVVISDIDGTITKSDVLGHILPIIGNDWSQSGVAQLFTQINANGYKMLYLSARAIGQAQVTREYLKSIRQGDVTLPDGPLLLNPTSLMAAFHREVIEKKPEEFKIACLKDIQTLFPRNPFYAGYGNRINDVWSYRAVDINISRIFTINHKGELRHALTNSFQSSYTSLVELAEHIFPAYKLLSFCDMDGYSSFEFWREPLPAINGASQNERTIGDSPVKGKGRPRSNTLA